jgi:hypothetical protein
MAAKNNIVAVSPRTADNRCNRRKVMAYVDGVPVIRIYIRMTLVME